MIKNEQMEYLLAFLIEHSGRVSERLLITKMQLYKIMHVTHVAIFILPISTRLHSYV